MKSFAQGGLEMGYEETFLQTMVDDPSTAPLFADWLEDHGDPRGELLRLRHILTQRTDQPNRTALEERLRALVTSGVQPVGPFRTNAVDMRFAWIPPGTFLMGSPANEPEREGYAGADETQHGVTLTKGFHLGIHQVTQAQWQAVMGANPSDFEGDGNLPVENVSWDDCEAFCQALGKKDGKTYRLPTEAEWEYACRAATTTPFHFGGTISTDQSNYDGNYTYGGGKKGVYRQKTTPAGSFPANAWGLFDMHGNVLGVVRRLVRAVPRRRVKRPSRVCWRRRPFAVAVRGAIILELPLRLSELARARQPYQQPRLPGRPVRD